MGKPDKGQDIGSEPWTGRQVPFVPLSFSSISGLCVYSSLFSRLSSDSSIPYCLNDVCEVIFTDKGLEKTKMLTKKLTSLPLLQGKKMTAWKAKQRTISLLC